MRIALFVPLALIAAPALAHQQSDYRPAPDAAQVATALGDPVVQEGVATVISQMVGAILDTHVGPLAHYTDPRDDVRAGDTLRDLAHRGDPAFERHLHDNARYGAAVVGRSARDAVAMSAELGATAERLRRILDSSARAVDMAREGY
ncbi:MAG: hypothetical protein ABIS14_08870 [Sphingomonas sp.]